MPSRPIWRGQIRLALVSIPVELFPATRSGAQIQFHQVHEPTGKRIKYEKVVPGVGPVDRDEIVKGYEVSKGHYVLLDPEEIESVKLESRKTLDLVEFVDDDGIDAMYFDKPYYVVPAGEVDPNECHKRCVDRQHKLIEEKQKAKGEKIIQDADADTPPPKGSNVIDLMAALKKSLGDEKRGKSDKGEDENPKKAAAKKP